MPPSAAAAAASVSISIAWRHPTRMQTWKRSMNHSNDSREHPEVAELVTLRHFVRLSIPEAASVLKIAPRTADSWWAYARAWLAADMAAQPQPEANDQEARVRGPEAENEQKSD